MDELKDQVQNATFAQKDPLVEYKIQSRKLFNQLNIEIAKELSSFLFMGMIPIQEDSQVRQAREPKVSTNKNVQTNIDQQREMEEMQRKAMQKQTQQVIEKVQPRRVEQKVGRNDMCPCGSGKKYKNCHGKSE
jgi:preprotein translocase subunit SecA